MKLSKLPLGQLATFIAVDDIHLALKLLEFGITENSEVKVIRKAPANGPLLVEGSKAKVILRREDAAQIQVKVRD